MMAEQSVTGIDETMQKNPAVGNENTKWETHKWPTIAQSAISTIHGLCKTTNPQAGLLTGIYSSCSSYSTKKQSASNSQLIEMDQFPAEQLM